MTEEIDYPNLLNYLNSHEEDDQMKKEIELLVSKIEKLTQYNVKINQELKNSYEQMEKIEDENTKLKEILNQKKSDLTENKEKFEQYHRSMTINNNAFKSLQYEQEIKIDELEKELQDKKKEYETLIEKLEHQEKNTENHQKQIQDQHETKENLQQEFIQIKEKYSKLEVESQQRNKEYVKALEDKNKESDNLRLNLQKYNKKGQKLLSQLSLLKQAKKGDDQIQRSLRKQLNDLKDQFLELKQNSELKLKKDNNLIIQLVRKIQNKQFDEKELDELITKYDKIKLIKEDKFELHGEVNEEAIEKLEDYDIQQILKDIDQEDNQSFQVNLTNDKINNQENSNMEESNENNLVKNPMKNKQMTHFSEIKKNSFKKPQFQTNQNDFEKMISQQLDEIIGDQQPFQTKKIEDEVDKELKEILEPPKNDDTQKIKRSFPEDLFNNLELKISDFEQAIEELEKFLLSDKNITTFILTNFDIRKLKEGIQKKKKKNLKYFTLFFWKFLLKQIFYLEEKIGSLTKQNSEIRLRLDHKKEEFNYILKLYLENNKKSQQITNDLMKYKKLKKKNRRKLQEHQLVQNKPKEQKQNFVDSELYKEGSSPIKPKNPKNETSINTKKKDQNNDEKIDDNKLLSSENDKKSKDDKGNFFSKVTSLFISQQIQQMKIFYVVFFMGLFSAAQIIPINRFQEAVRIANVFITFCKNPEKSCEEKINLFKKVFEIFFEKYKKKLKAGLIMNPNLEELKKNVSNSLLIELNSQVLFVTQNLKEKLQIFDLEGKNEQDIKDWFIEILFKVPQNIEEKQKKIEDKQKKFEITAEQQILRTIELKRKYENPNYQKKYEQDKAFIQKTIKPLKKGGINDLDLNLLTPEQREVVEKYKKDQEKLQNKAKILAKEFFNMNKLEQKNKKSKKSKQKKSKNSKKKIPLIIDTEKNEPSILDNKKITNITLQGEAENKNSFDPNEKTQKLAENKSSNSNPVEFDLDAFLKEMDEFDCNSDKSSTEFNESFNQLCDENIQKIAFKPIGEFREDGTEFWNELNEKVYLPLAFEMEQKGSVSELLKDLVLLSDNHNVIENENLKDNFDNFEKKVLEDFYRLQEESSKSNNHEKISEEMTQILKNFHIHWNSLRINKELNRVKGETKNIMRKILQNYEVKEKFMKEIAKFLVEKIKMAYGKFIRAHMTHQLLLKNAPDMIGDEIVRRFLKQLKTLKLEERNPNRQIEFIADILTLAKSFHMVSYRIGFTERKCIHYFETEIFQKIQNVYFDYIKSITDITHEDSQRYKFFTAICLLKMKMINFIIFQHEGIGSVIAMPFSVQEQDKNTVVKVYNELADNLMLLPQKCVGFFMLENCAYFQTNKALKYISGKYKLRRSTNGWILYNFIRNSIKDLYSQANRLIWGNFTLFKNYFYQNLFSLLKNYQQKFLLKDTQEIDDLENKLGEIIENFENSVEDKTHLNFGLINDLNQRLYDAILVVKANYNQDAPLKQKSFILTQIENDIKNFLIEFKKINEKDINDIFLKLLEQIRLGIEAWKEEIPKMPDYTVQISELPLNTVNLYPQVFHTVLGEPVGSKQEQLNKGFLPFPQSQVKKEIIEKVQEEKKVEKNEIKNKDELLKEEIKKQIQENPEQVIDRLYQEMKAKNQMIQEKEEKNKSEIYIDEVSVPFEAGKIKTEEKYVPSVQTNTFNPNLINNSPIIQETEINDQDNSFNDLGTI